MIQVSIGSNNGFQECRIQPPVPNATSKDVVSGRVRWRFRIQWSAGGEESLWPDRVDVLKHPWWSPVHESPADAPGSAIDLQRIAKPEDEFPTIHQNSCKQNDEYKCKDNSLQELYYYLLPAHLLKPFTALLPDANFPRGWVCRKCGRMNFQRSMRRRKCPSASCKVIVLMNDSHES